MMTNEMGETMKSIPIVALMLTFFAAPLTAQEVSGLVAEHWTLAPVPAAVVTLFLLHEEEDSDPQSIATVLADEEGAFRFEDLTRGRYRVQAEYDGLTSPMSSVLDLAADDSVMDLVLMVPSPLLILASACDLEAVGGSVVVGTVLDEVSEVPLPGATVTAQWTVDSRQREAVTETNGRGHFQLCGVGPSSDVRFRAQTLGRESSWVGVSLVRPALVFHDISIPFAEGATERSELIAEQTLLEMRGAMGDLRGILVDIGTGEPIRQAIVRVLGTSLQGMTDDDGSFTFSNIQPGVYTLEIRHLGYSVQSGEVEVPEGRDVLVHMRLSPQAMELEGISVTVRSRVEAAIRTAPFRRSVVTGRQILEAEERGARPADVLRASVPGLRVTERYTVFGTDLCIMTNRRIQRLMEGPPPRGEPCREMVALVIDGTRIGAPDAANVLLGLSMSDVESIEFLQPMQAATLYGTGGNVANGVVVIWTRGKGPYTSSSRNR